MPRFIVEAIKFTGNDREVLAFCPGARDPEDSKPNLIIPTPHGERLVSVGDYVVKVATLPTVYYVVDGTVFEAIAKREL